MRRVLLLLPVLASAIALVPAARGAEPAAGTLSHDAPSLTWTGSTALQTPFISGVGCEEPVLRVTCDTFALTVEALDGTDAEDNPLPDDVLVAIATPNLPENTVAEFDLYVYGPDGALVASSTELGPDSVVLYGVAPATYTVGVQSPVSTDPTSEYEGRATVVEAGDSAPPVDAEEQCGFEGEEAVRGLDVVGAGAAAGDPDAALDGLDGEDRIELRVQAVLDGITEAEADAIFAGAAASYEPLGIDLVAVKPYLTHSFGTDDADAIIRKTQALFGGQRPAGVHVVEALVGFDIQQLNLYAVAGLADCIGGVAHPDRAFLVAEGHTPSNYSVPFVDAVQFGYDANPHVTAHEIGHLMGGQHHYANCVESIEQSDVHEDHVEGSPCTLMSNFADFIGPQFGALNGAVVRGTAERYVA